MKKGYFSVGTAALLSLGLFTSQALAQTESFCSATGHSGESAELNYNHVGTVGDKGYELWCDKNTSTCKATFYADGSMYCQFQGADDYLCRSGLMLQSQGKTYDQFGGDIYAEYKLVKSNTSGIDYSYVGVYGWMENVPGAPSGLVEYYIVDNTLSQYMPSDWVGNEKIAEGVSIDGGTYNVYRNTRTGPAIGSSSDVTFYQYFSIRSGMRDCGTINISAHMRKWEELGLKMGKLYEARVLGEAGSTHGNVATGTVDFPYANVFISNGTAPTSSASTNPTSSASTNPTSSSAAQNLTAVGSLPGTLEFEDFQNKEGSFTANGGSLGNIEPGDWAEYTVTVTYPGTYNFDLTAAREDDQGRKTNISLSIDGTSIATISDILTTGWDAYESFTGTTAKLEAGTHTLRVEFTGGYVNVDKIVFTEGEVDKSSPYTPPASIRDIRMSLDGDKSLQVFDLQGKFLGLVSVAKGGNVAQAVKARVQKAGVYLVKQGGSVQRIAIK